MTDSVKTWGGVAIAAIKTYSGIAKASVKSIGGVPAGLTYATFDPAHKGNNAALSGGNLILTNSTSTVHAPARATIGKSAGKWWYEFTIASVNNVLIGLVQAATATADGDYPGAYSTSWGYAQNGNWLTNATPAALGATFTVGDVIRCEADLDGHTVAWFKNNAQQGTAKALTAGQTYYPCVSVYQTSQGTANFGASASAGTPTAGFSGWSV